MSEAGDARKRDKMRRELLEGLAQEFIFRIRLVRINEKDYDWQEYRKRFCHEHCISVEELNEFLVREYMARGDDANGK